jgi:tetratricopeptide (TPR) repeat protein
MRLPTLVTLLLVLAVGAARADNKSLARQLYQGATKHYKLGEYREALAAFKDAYRNYEDPSFLFNIGQCHRMLDEKREAIRAFKTYLSEVQAAPNRAEVLRMIHQLEETVKHDEEQKDAPPTGTLPTQVSPEPIPEATQAPQPQVQVAPPPPARPVDTPTYKKWWVWTIVGVAAVGAGLGVGLGLGLREPRGPATPAGATPLGTF